MELRPAPDDDPHPRPKDYEIDKAFGPEDDITLSQEQQTLPDRLPQSLIEWLARINQRYLALSQEKTNEPS